MHLVFKLENRAGLSLRCRLTILHFGFVRESHPKCLCQPDTPSCSFANSLLHSGSSSVCCSALDLRSTGEHCSHNTLPLCCYRNRNKRSGSLPCARQREGLHARSCLSDKKRCVYCRVFSSGSLGVPAERKTIQSSSTPSSQRRPIVSLLRRRLTRRRSVSFCDQADLKA